MASLSICYQLLCRELTIFRSRFGERLVNMGFVFFTNVIVFNYFLAPMGMGPNYGPFIMVGAIAIFGLFDLMSYVSEMVMDMEGSRRITHTLSLPLSSAFVFASIGFNWAVTSAILMIFLVPVGKILLWNQFDLSGVSWWRFAIIYPLIHLFFGYFSLWISSIFSKASQIGNIWTRMINPLFMFGCYFFPYSSIVAISPLLAKVLLINPFIYITEGLRSAMLGAEGNLPFWICPIALSFYCLFFVWHSVKRFKRILDCV